MLSTKRYTDAKLRRAVLFSMCGVKKGDILALPSYTYLLGANPLGRELLSATRRKDTITIITKPADATELSFSGEARQRNLDLKLASIYNLCLATAAPTGESMRKKPYIT